MSEAAAIALRDKLNLEQLDLDLFRAQNEATLGDRLFGGQVLAQALAAAQETIDERPCHSLHGYFLRPGKVDIPVIFQVERIRDGKSFSTRRIIGIQNGQAIFSMDASFQVKEAGTAPPDRCSAGRPTRGPRGRSVSCYENGRPGSSWRMDDAGTALSNSLGRTH